MKIRIEDIHEGGYQVNVDSANAQWLKDVFLDVFGKEKFQEGDNGRLDVQLFKDGKNVTVIGGVILKFHPSCDRCLTEFPKTEQITIHQVMAPAYVDERPDKGKKESQTADEDEDFGIYTNGEIDLDAITREYVILSQDMVNLCSDECKGLCPKCGKNLNKGPCRCKATVKKVKSPFAVLKKIPT